MKRVIITSILAGCLACGGSSSRPGKVSRTTAIAGRPSGSPPLFDGLGPHTRRVTTSSPEAQRYVDQGLAFLSGFNHDEAERSFLRAAELDPSCAMAHWGVAMANGPHINNPDVDAAHAKAAWAALERTRAASGASTVERALVDAIGKRYAEPQPADRKPLDQAYADAMRKVHAAHPDDVDVTSWFAEALMDLRPWDYWTVEGRPQTGTEEILSLLGKAMNAAPNAPLAIQLYIHVVEASPRPERADAPADRLRDLAPGLGHLVHMPSHIDIRRGRWKEAITANEKALAAIRSMVDGIDLAWARENVAIADGLFAMPVEVLMRFGRWEEILAAPEPAEIFTLTRTLRHYARGVAYAAEGDVTKARAEQSAMLETKPKYSKYPAAALVWYS